MLEVRRKGFAVMSADLKGISFESENYLDCLRYLHKGYVIAERIPYVSGFGFDIYWLKQFYKPIQIRKYGQSNILWLHFSFHRNYLHKTGKIVPLCDHPDDKQRFGHDMVIICEKCHCYIGQFGKYFDVPKPI